MGLSDPSPTGPSGLRHVLHSAIAVPGARARVGHGAGQGGVRVGNGVVRGGYGNG